MPKEDKMRKLVARRPSPALVVACLALFVSLGGTSLAVVNALPRNSVGAVQLRNNAVNSPKVKNGALLAVDFKAGQLPKGDKGDKGDPGAAGSKGDTGAKGDTGPNPAATAIVRQAIGPSSSTTSEALVSCQSDERAVGGGAAWSSSSGGGNPAVITDMPTPGGAGTIPTGWRGVVRNMASVGTVTGRVFVVCVKQ
jgi:hypothetical protein